MTNKKRNLFKQAKVAIIDCLVAHPKLVIYGLTLATVAIMSTALSSVGHEVYAATNSMGGGFAIKTPSFGMDIMNIFRAIGAEY
jgi:hypothetical protein